ncbi:MAG TPA: hypothetical protein VFN19_07520, partial [Candidatus Nanopelagicales bacterium]|nr:hypothetical protein [Candidatus Nanopelagicales bacterium]
MSRALPTAWAVAGTVGALASVLLPAGLWRSVTGLAVGFGAAVVVVLGTRLHRPPSPRPWLLLAAALATFAAAEAVTALVDGAWAVDALRLAGYPLLVAALVAVWLARRSDPGSAGWAGWVDAVVVAVTTALGYWVFVIDLEGLDTTAQAVQLAFLVADVVVVALVTRLVVADVSSTAFVLLAAGVAVLVGTDIAVLLQTDVTAGPAPELAHAGWLIASVLMATAALHPSMSTVTEAAPAREEPEDAATRLGLLGAVV